VYYLSDRRNIAKTLALLLILGRGIATARGGCHHFTQIPNIIAIFELYPDETTIKGGSS
jgi:hypothetical protein